MSPLSSLARRVFLSLWLTGMGVLAMAAEPPPWKSSEIGAPPAAGDHHWQEGSLTVRGAGKGAVAAHEDQLHFVSLPTEGDVELVARLASFDGKGQAEAGLMIRAGESATAPMGAVAYLPEAPHLGKDGTKYHGVELRGRNLEMSIRPPRGARSRRWRLRSG